MFILKNFKILEKNIFELLKKITLKTKFEKIKLRIKIGNFGKKNNFILTINCNIYQKPLKLLFLISKV
jgi:hypothetical protein